MRLRTREPRIIIRICPAVVYDVLRYLLEACFCGSLSGRVQGRGYTGYATQGVTVEAAKQVARRGTSTRVALPMLRCVALTQDHPMTLPCERTRAVLQTREFLKSLVRNADLPSNIREDAKLLLRHYPEARHLSVVATVFERLSLLPLEDETLGLLLMTGPVFEDPRRN